MSKVDPLVFMIKARNSTAALNHGFGEHAKIALGVGQRVVYMKSLVIEK